MTGPPSISENLCDAELIVDVVYRGGQSGRMNADPIHKLIPGVGNQGGFRFVGTIDKPRLIVLTSSFNDPDWPDRIDRETGILTYYGDNKRPGRGLHETPRNGNRLLRDVFDALHSKPPLRPNIPPILLFGSAGTYRDVVFLGLAVPGAPELSPLEDLVAVWKISKGQRFQNYRACLTILDVWRIEREWLRHVINGEPLSPECPSVWRKWIETGFYHPLRAERTIEFRTREEQLPGDEQSLSIIRTLHDYFRTHPVRFEACAAALTQMLDRNFFSFDLTRSSRDGGRDAIGLYRIGSGTSAITVDFALEAKCYGLNNSVGVRDMSRLISRLRHRQFGALITTSYLHSQAYRELKEDGHPVIVIAAADIVRILSNAGMNTANEVRHWLESTFPIEVG